MTGRMVGLILFGASLAPAQLPTGAISGRVLDSSGAAIPGATVTAASRETGRVQSTETSTSGYYKTISPVGVYDVRVEAPSFRPEVRQSLKLEVAQEAVLNFTLSVGSVQETVTVTAEVPLVETTSGSLGGLVNEQRMSDLPLNGRSFNQLVLLQPGITLLRTASATNAPSVGLSFSSNGAPIKSNFQTMDGANLANHRGSTGVSPSGAMLGVEGIREFRVMTNSFSAEYGMTMGSQMAVVSKGGTNEFHGSAFEFLRNSALDARNFFDRKRVETDPRIPAFRRNNFGGSFGGPIRRDNAFFFATYGGVRESRGLTQVLAVPTAEARRDGFLVPQVAESVKPYLNLYPLPTEPLPTDLTGRSGVGRFTYIYNQPTTEHFVQGRGDYNFSELDSAFVRYTFVDATRIQPLDLPGYTGTQFGQGRYITFAENHTFSSTVLNTFRFSYSRSDQPSDREFDPRDLDLGFVPGKRMGQLRPGSGLTNLGSSSSTAPENFQNIYTVSNDVFWSKGAHSLKFGTLINRYNQQQVSLSTDLGEYRFADLTQFLLGRPRQFLVLTPGSIPDMAWRFTTFGFYLQDDWRVAPTFTLNLGLRYEFLNTVRYTGRGSALIDLVRDAEFTVTSVMFKNPSRRNFGPRLGFAWDVLGNATTSLRGGFGLLYDVGNFYTAHGNVAERPPFSGKSTVLTNVGFPRTIIPPEAVGKVTSAIDYNYQQPHMLHYNLTVERQLPASIVLSLSYAGSRGINLANIKEGNPAVRSGKIDGRDFWPANAPLTNPNWDAIEYHTTGSNSWYNSLQFSVQKRLSRGLQFQSSYTWSNVLDTTQGAGGEGGALTIWVSTQIT